MFDMILYDKIWYEMIVLSHTTQYSMFRWIATEKREMECSHFYVFFFNHCSEGNICTSNKDSGPVCSPSISMLCWATHMNGRTCVTAPLQLSAVTWAPSLTSHHSWEQHRKKYEEAWVESQMSDKVVLIQLSSCSRILGLICKRLQVKFLRFMTCGDIIHGHYQWIWAESRSKSGHLIKSLKALCFKCQT